MASILRPAPATQLVLVCIAVLAGVLAATTLAVQGPWLGWTVSRQFNAPPRLEASSDAAREVLSSGRVLAIGGIPVEWQDFVEEPDALESYAQMSRFFVRQTALSHALSAPEVDVELEAPDGHAFRARMRPNRSRPLRSLPGTFWFQLFVAAMTFVAASWVTVLRPRDFAARMFGLSGLSVALSAVPAAVYSAREIALDGTLFRALSFTNHLGACLFGCSLIALFLSYPTGIGRGRWCLVPFAIFLPWSTGADLSLAFGSPAIGFYVLIVIQTVIIVGLVAVQWRKGRRDPRARAALSWIGLGAVLSAGAYVITVGIPELLSAPPLVSQGYSFGFFLLLYAALAVGLRRDRLFELDELSYRVLWWIVGAIAFAVLDTGLVLLVGLDQRLSTGLSLVVCGSVYLPLRTWLWRRLPQGTLRDERALFRIAVELTFAPASERVDRWKALLQTAFDPLTIEERPETELPADARIEEDGVALLVPRASGSPTLALTFLRRGRALFGPREARLTNDLVDFVRHAEQGRESFERGVRAERHRIARDLHDDLGARLLSGLHQADLDGTREMVRRALDEMRSLVATLAAEDKPLDAVLADVRHEAAERLAAANIALDWPLTPEWAERAIPNAPMVALNATRHYPSIVRELVSNVIRHSHATKLRVSIEGSARRFVTTLEDDGVGLEGAGHAGHGFGNIEQRAREAGGSIVIRREGARTCFVVELPLKSDG